MRSLFGNDLFEGCQLIGLYTREYLLRPFSLELTGICDYTAQWRMLVHENNIVDITSPEPYLFSFCFSSLDGHIEVMATQNDVIRRTVMIDVYQNELKYHEERTQLSPDKPDDGVVEYTTYYLNDSESQVVYGWKKRVSTTDINTLLNGVRNANRRLLEAQTTRPTPSEEKRLVDKLNERIQKIPAPDRLLMGLGYPVTGPITVPQCENINPDDIIEPISLRGEASIKFQMGLDTEPDLVDRDIEINFQKSFAQDWEEKMLDIFDQLLGKRHNLDPDKNYHEEVYTDMVLTPGILIDARKRLLNLTEYQRMMMVLIEKFNNLAPTLEVDKEMIIHSV